ncbi:MAG: SDR family oxidoreductase [Thermodesulfobacteriota bacterium]
MRLPGEVISEKRDRRDTAFLLTGGTGFLGSHISVELLKRGYRVILVCRPNRHESALQRVNRLLEWFGRTREVPSQPEVIEGDLTKQNLGLSDSRYTYLLEDIWNNGGRKADKLGIRIENDGSLYLPIRIGEHNGGGLNLIPIDYFVDSFVTLVHARLDSSIFHIVADRQKTIDELLQYIRDFFRLRGITTASREALDKAPKNALEILYDSYLHTYHPYIQDTRTFSSEKTKSLLQAHHIECPDFTFPVFTRCMDYAVEVDWGRKLR